MGGGDKWEFSELYTQFFYKPNTALEKFVDLKKNPNRHLKESLKNSGGDWQNI